MFDLPFIWAGLIAFAVLAYVLFDGFDLGIGILFPFLRSESERDQAMNSVAPVWDGNETWLLLGGGGLMAAFPVAYALLGAAWLIMKTTAELQERARRFAWITALGTLALIGVVSLWTPLLTAQFRARWFAWPAILYSAPVPLLVALAAFVLFAG